MTSSEIRKRFLDFFAAREHRTVRSSSLVPANDPTLLFTNAGMNQFKDVFLGREKSPYGGRACSSQKCVRAGGKHNDLEQVGRTTRHHTFFEMLGNFSFGDYFKRDAIAWAWELVTKDFEIPPVKLYATVFREDDEAEELWAKIVARERIFRFDEKDNFWAMGETGPCGPCSEIHYDLGPAASDLGHKDCKFPCDCGRYVELWNLVFMQFSRDEQGNMTPLPRPSIDTGAGLERFATVLQGRISNFDTDLFRPLIEEAAELASVEYGVNHDTDVSLRIIADHSRAAAFLISDGVLPSNEGRGYVLRKIIRRAILHGRKLGLEELFLYKMAGQVAQMMKRPYPDLLESELRVAKMVKAEETRFAKSLSTGSEEFKRELTHSLKGFSKELRFMATQSGDARFISELEESGDPEYVARRAAELMRKNDVIPTFSGRAAFFLYDTFGWPLDFIQDACRDLGFELDTEGFHQSMAEQRVRARASWKGAAKQTVDPVYLSIGAGMFSVPLPEGGVKIQSVRNSEFLGHEQAEIRDCEVFGIIQDGRSKFEVSEGEEAEIVLRQTPFYAQAGGQVGDVGHFLDHSGTELARITDTYYPASGVIAHKAVIRSDRVQVGDVVTAVVDTERRDAIRRNHTATHLLHAALRKTLGTHVKQAGSLVAPDRLRFDFAHYAALDEQDLLDIEDLVNEHVLANEQVNTDVMDLDAAVNAGAMALFGEKYGDRVRVVSIEDGSFSKELCGGTHVRRTGDIGLFKVAAEGSVAAGTRRIEALTGEGVLKQLREASGTLALLSQALRTKPDELLQAAEKLAESEKKLRKQLEAQQMKRAVSQAGDLVDKAKDVKGVRVISERVDVPDRAAMRQMVDSLRPKLGSGVIVLGSEANGDVALVAAVSKDLTAKLDAGKIVKAAAAIVEGSGGGRKDLAEAGGKNPEKLDESLQAIPGIVEKML